MIVLFRIITVLTIVGFGVFILTTRHKVDPQTASSESQGMNLNTR
jgi:hypothetical protein